MYVYIRLYVGLVLNEVYQNQNNDFFESFFLVSDTKEIWRTELITNQLTMKQFFHNGEAQHSAFTLKTLPLSVKQTKGDLYSDFQTTKRKESENTEKKIRKKISKTVLDQNAPIFVKGSAYYRC